jgi:hypothetical protein
MCAKRTFCPLFFVGCQRSATRWAHRLESLCSVLPQRIFYPLKFLVVAAAITGGSYNAFGKALRFHFRDGHFPSAE